MAHQITHDKLDKVARSGDLYVLHFLRNNFVEDDFKKRLGNNEPCVLIDVDLIRQLDSDEKMTQLKDKSTGCNQNKNKETIPKEPVDIRKEIALHVSSSVFLTIINLEILLQIWNHSSLMNVQPQHMEHVPVSIWSSLLGLLGFMMFIWAIATMILVDAPFNRLHCVMLIFWAIMMHFTSANSTRAVFASILGIFSYGVACAWSWKTNRK